MRLKRMPSTILLLVFSWISAIAALSIGGFYCFSSLKIGLGIIFTGLLLASTLRMMANMGEMVFNLHADVLSVIKNIEQSLFHLTRILADNFKETQQNLRQINSDSRDINQNLHKMWSLFENIKDTLER